MSKGASHGRESSALRAGGPAAAETPLTAPRLLFKVRSLICGLLSYSFQAQQIHFMLQLIFLFISFWPVGGGRGLSAAQSLKCKLIFYVIFQYIFYSLNLFENVCGLFYQTILYSQSAAFWSR